MSKQDVFDIATQLVAKLEKSKFNNIEVDGYVNDKFMSCGCPALFTVLIEITSLPFVTCGIIVVVKDIKLTDKIIAQDSYIVKKEVHDDKGLVGFIPDFDLTWNKLVNEIEEKSKALVEDYLKREEQMNLNKKPKEV